MRFVEIVEKLHSLSRMQATSLNVAFTGKIPNAAFFCLDIKTQISSKSYKVMDASKYEANLEVETSKPQITSKVIVGTKVRVIFPKIDANLKTILVTDKTKIFPMSVKPGNFIVLILFSPKQNSF